MPHQDKQKDNHAKLAFGRRPTLWIVLCFLGISVQSSTSQSVSGRSGEHMATMRLIGARTPKDGAYRAAIVITMPAGSHTYWRSPGEAGVPPDLTVTGSSNLATADLLFPAPTRLKEDGIEAYGYADHVTFPLLVKPLDPGKPTTVHVDLAYAVCDRICMPARGTATLTLPAPVSNADGDAVAEAFDKIPAALPTSDATALDIVPIPDAGGHQSWRLTWHGQAPLRDVFIEAPDGFAFDMKHAAAPDFWTLTATQATSARQVAVTLTVTGAKQSFVTQRTLDVRATKP